MNDKLKNTISEYYGRPSSIMEIEVDGRPDSDPVYSWESGNLNIILKKFSNIKQLKKHDKCFIVILGNMKYQDIMSVSGFDSIK